MSLWLATAPGLDALLAPHERVLWPIVIGIAVFGALGVWVGRRQRRARPRGRGTHRGDDRPGGADAGARASKHTRPE